jgi:Na+/proline symporter
MCVFILTTWKTIHLVFVQFLWVVFAILSVPSDHNAGWLGIWAVGVHCWCLTLISWKWQLISGVHLGNWVGAVIAMGIHFPYHIGPCPRAESLSQNQHAHTFILSVNSQKGIWKYVSRRNWRHQSRTRACAFRTEDTEAVGSSGNTSELY